MCHCLLIETNQGLVLVDTGIGQQDVEHPRRLGFSFNFFVKPAYQPKETACAQIKALGFSPQDVRHIIATHLDVDHAGGLPDFPHATVHVHEAEWTRATQHRVSHMDRMRYFPHHWAHQVQWETYSEEGEAWYGMQAVRSLRGLPEDILLIPLFGHSVGHCGIAVRSAQGWLLHCGDAYFHRNQIHPLEPSCPAGLRLFQSIAQTNKARRLENIRRLQTLHREQGPQIRMFCAHDHVEWATQKASEPHTPLP